MKLKPEMDSAAAFPDATHEPSEADLKAALGPGPVGNLLAQELALFRSSQPSITTSWQFSPRSGWYQLHLRKKRRLLYLMPKRGDFRLMMLLGGKAIESLKQGPYARQTTRLLKTAKRYPEGTAFSFDRSTLDPDLLSVFLAAKIAH